MTRSRRSIHSPPRFIVISGAGLSADSGIPTFSEQNGLYAKFPDPAKILTPEILRTAPDIIHEFCDDFRVSLRHAKPNIMHEALVEIEKALGDDFFHLTQNIDDLMERSGSTKTVHLHGKAREIYAVGNSKEILDIGYRRYWTGPLSDATPDGLRFKSKKTKSYYRPNIVLFSETAPEYSKLHKLCRELRRDDTVVIIGTHGKVIPLSDIMSQTHCQKILINAHKSPYLSNDLFDIVIQNRAINATDELLGIADQFMNKKAALTI